MAEALSDAERARILELHGEHMSRNAIAREVGRSPGIVSKVVRDAGLSFERGEQVAAATAAKQMDNKVKRARLQELLLDDALRIRTQLWEPALVYSFGGRENTYAEHTLPRPDFAGQNAIMRTVGVAIDKAAKLAEQDRTSADPAAAVSLLGDLVDNLRDKYADEGAEGDSEPSDPQ